MLELGGFTPLSTSDWPGRLVAVAFVQGCPWRCSYCHNPALQPRRGAAGPAWRDVLALLGRRVGLLDGLVFSGGEPTIARALPEAVSEVRALGLQVGLHTAGIYPERLAALLPGLDWVGFDLKTDAAGYAALTGSAGASARVRAALDAVLASGVDVEIRSTYHPALVDDAALQRMAQWLAAAGARRWVLQAWQPCHGDAPRLTAGWHWPAPELLGLLRQQMPELALR